MMMVVTICMRNCLDSVNHVDVRSTRQRPNKVESSSTSKPRVLQHDFTVFSSATPDYTEPVADRSHARPGISCLSILLRDAYA